MSKIKTRETGKDIKVLDKSAVVGQRMKNAFIRSKRNVAALPVICDRLSASIALHCRLRSFRNDITEKSDLHVRIFLIRGNVRIVRNRTAADDCNLYFTHG